MDVAVTPAVAKAAGAAVAKVLGGFVPKVIGRARRRRTVRRSVTVLADRARGEHSLEQLSPVEVARVVSYVRLPDFEQFAIQVTGLVLQDKLGAAVIGELRSGLARSLWLHGVAKESVAEVVADSLFDELWSAVAEAVRAAGPLTPGNVPAAAASASMRAAAVTRNCRLLERLRSLDEIHAFTVAVRAQIIKVDGMVRPPHMESGRRVPLAHLYVEPSLVPLGNRLTEKSAEPLPLKNLLASQLRTVVLGDPGGGKSTLAAKLACQVAGRRHRDHDARVPFLVVMREYAQRLERDQLSIARYLQAMVGARYQIEATRECVEFLLLNGRGVVIFDGLDELVDTSLRRRVTEAVEAFAHAYPTTALVATSRQVGYEQAPLDPSLFVAFRLAEFDDEQVAEYTRKWFALYRDLPLADQEQLAQAFLREGQYVSDLRRNPLMLGLMCALYRGERYIPRNRLDVYERCSVLLFERWDRQRGIQVPLPFEQHVRPALWALALWMFTNTGTATERELVSAVRRYLLQKRFEDVDEAEAAANTFVEYCRGRAWVLTEVGTTGDGEPLFAFTHRTFLEYFAANQLVRTNSSAAALGQVLTPRLRAEEWDVVAQLAVLILDRNVDGGADDFIDLLVRSTESLPRDERSSILIFVARLLQYVVPTPQVRRRTFQACWGLASSLEADAPQSRKGSERHLDALSLLLVSADENHDSIAAMIRASVVADTDHGISALLAVRLDQLANNVWFGDDWKFKCVGFWHAESVRNSGLLREWMRGAARKFAWAAVEATCTGDWSVRELISVHGAAAVCEASIVWGNYRRCPIIQQEVLASHSDVVVDGRWIDSGAGARAHDLATSLPQASTPWARLSRVPWWDMDIKDPVNTIEPGTSMFDVIVMASCLYWEVRALMRQMPDEEVSPGPLPSWLWLPAEHPASVVVTGAAMRRYHQVEPLVPIPERWLSAEVRDLVARWASDEVHLVANDLSPTG